jgi:hypothetical protein
MAGCALVHARGLSAEVELFESVLFDAEVVCNLMQQRPPDALPQAAYIAGAGEVWLGIDKDPVGQCQVVVGPPPGQRYPLIEAQESLTPAQAGVPPLLPGWARQDSDLDVIQSLMNLFGKPVIDFLNEPFEAAEFWGQLGSQRVL